MADKTFSVPLPPGFSLDDLARVPQHMVWDGERVLTRLIEAVRIAEHAIKSPRPKGAPAMWPSWVYDFEDLADQKEEDKAPSRTVPRFRINEMEQALTWQSKYLSRHEGPARVLRTYLRCKAHRRSFAATIRQKGWSRATAYRARDKAVAIIAFSLMRDGIPPYPQEAE